MTYGITTGSVALRGRHGMYFSYYFDGLCHLRIHGSVDDDDVWATFPATPESWIPLACLTVISWERASESQFLAIFETREGAWLVAKTGEEKRDRATFYSEWFTDGLWHVASVHPRAQA